jgi:hypothetical protein
MNMWGQDYRKGFESLLNLVSRESSQKALQDVYSCADRVDWDCSNGIAF